MKSIKSIHTEPNLVKNISNGSAQKQRGWSYQYAVVVAVIIGIGFGWLFLLILILFRLLLPSAIIVLPASLHLKDRIRASAPAVHHPLLPLTRSSIPSVHKPDHNLRVAMNSMTVVK